MPFREFVPSNGLHKHEPLDLFADRYPPPAATDLKGQQNLRLDIDRYMSFGLHTVSSSEERILLRNYSVKRF